MDVALRLARAGLPTERCRGRQAREFFIGVYGRAYRKVSAQSIHRSGEQRGHVLRTFRPDVAEVLAQIRGRRSCPVINTNTCDIEARLCAMYVADYEFNLRVLSARLHVRRERAKEVLDGWGVNWADRSLRGAVWARAKDLGATPLAA